MKVIKIIFTVTAITMALTLFFTTRNSVVSPPPPENASQPFKQAAAAKRVSRFLQQNDKNPRAADHCNKDNEICSQFSDGKNTTTCCNNKCIDLKYDDDNCGACKNRCVFTKSCCRGQCVDLAFDKRHCGACNTRCMTGGFCIYGMCDYA